MKNSIPLLLIILLPLFECRKLIEETKCEIKKLCGNLNTNTELDVLECLQNYKASDFSEECQKIIHKHAKAYFEEDNIRKELWPRCTKDFKKLDCKEDERFLQCIFNKREQIFLTYCKHMVQRLEEIASLDFSLISDFKTVCIVEIENLKCSNLQSDNQAVLYDNTLDCLQKNIELVNTTSCRNSVLQLSEMQGEDTRLDSQLSISCAQDRRRLCSDVLMNNDEVVKCLQHHINDNNMLNECRQELLKREKLVIKDVKISRGLARMCREDIRKYRCRRLVSDDRGIKLAQMLLCLENAAHNGSGVNLKCRIEMVRHRKLLLEDYKLSPEVVGSCSNDIENFCKGLETGGKTIHCLMEHSKLRRKKDRVSFSCQRAVFKLLNVVDAGEDWRVDPVLRESCKPVVDLACYDVSGGNAKVMSCLMEHLGTKSMTLVCEKALMEIQYFISRDFKLDPILYKECHNDAARLCGSKMNWSDDDVDGNSKSLVLPCLYRYVYHPDSKLKLRGKCVEQVRRVMRQRAISVDLMPQVEESCLEDLAMYCNEKTDKGQEIICLQEKYLVLKPKCKSVVGNFTEAEVEDINLNPVVKSHCAPVIDAYCKDDLRNKVDNNDDNNNNNIMDDVMGCLIKHKNDPDVKIHVKCRAAIEHFQLITLNDYHFTVAFKTACKLYVTKFCHKSQTKPQVIECLSEIIRNDTLKDEKYKVSKECRTQVRSQLLQQRENIHFDPKLQSMCSEDMEKYCANVQPGSSNVLNCLEENIRKLSIKCHKTIFNIQQQDLTDSSSDYTLLKTCKRMIRQYCLNVDLSQALTCLKSYRNIVTFDTTCKNLVVRRMIEQSLDYRLDPKLKNNCILDIVKFCVPVINSGYPVELQGRVVKCLKVKYREGKLRGGCGNELINILRESALNYKLNPLLKNLCKDEIEIQCGNAEREEEAGNLGKLEECLKMEFLEGRVTNRACRLEIAGLIEESKADIHVDPILHRSCVSDIAKYCADVPEGAGRGIICGIDHHG